MKLPEKYKELTSDDTTYEISRFIALQEKEVVPIIPGDDKRNVIIADREPEAVEDIGPIVVQAPR